MACLPILTAVTLPAMSACPSSSCLQWSQDGQAVLLTRSTIYILTPDAGINVDSSSFIKESLDKELLSDSLRPLQWLRTMIEWDKDSEIYQWPVDCQDWGAVPLGSLDPYFRSVACSPSNLSSDAGCVFATLNSNLQVAIWHPIKNRLKGQWVKVGNWNGVRKGLSSPNDTDGVLQKTLKAQKTSIAWSSQPDFAILPAPMIDASLLAVGSRAGTVSFARYSGSLDSQAPLRHVATVPVCDRWVTQLAWSAWIPLKPGRCQAYLACGIADGSITVVKVVQTLQSLPSITGLIPAYEVFTECDALDRKVCEAGGGITSMKWIQTSQTDPTLIFSTPGQLHIWSSSSSAGAWCDPRVIIFRTEQLSVGSSSLTPVSGISYVRRYDALVVSLGDGSFHVVHNLSTEPALAITTTFEVGLSSETLSHLARSVFERVEADGFRKTDINRINGMMSYDESSVYVWIHEASRPTDFDYKHDAKHTGMFVVAQLWREDSDSELLERIANVVTNAKAATGEAPSVILRSAFLHLRCPERLSRLQNPLLEILQQPPQPDNSRDIILPAWAGELTFQMRREYRASLRAHLFGWDTLLCQRISASVATFCKNEARHPDVKQLFANTANSILTTIRHRVVRTIMQHIGAVTRLVSDTDVDFVLRIVIQALLPGTPSDLTLEARELSAKVNVVIPADFDLTVNTLGPPELCPACHAPVPFNDMDTAMCTNGHTWARCSITSFILSTPMVRTCVGCSRKAFLAVPDHGTGHNWLPTPARSWLVEDLLQAAQRCLFCGSSFVTLV